MRLVAAALLCAAAVAARAANPPPLADDAVDWAKEVGHGAVATAEKRDGTWSYAVAGQPFAEGRAAVPPERVLFEIGSITKVFTGILLGKAVVAGHVKLDDPISKYLPVEFEYPGTSAITLQQLVTHTSCLPRMPANVEEADCDEAALLRYLAHVKLGGKVPCEYSYSNLGVGLLGVILEHATGKPWEVQIRDAITTPLGMVDTVPVPSAEQGSRLAIARNGDAVEKASTVNALAGAGALRSTLADMSLFADALLAGPRGPFADVWGSLTDDLAPVPAWGGTIGLALVRAKDHGEDSYRHDGGTRGYRSTLVVYPESGRAVIVLASNGDADTVKWVMDWRGHETPAVQHAAIRVPGRKLEQYEGVYALDKDKRWTILRRGDGLLSRFTGQRFLPIAPCGKDAFFYETVDAQVEFTRDASGRIDGMVQYQSGKELRAARTSDAPTILFPSQATLDEYAGSYDMSGYTEGGVLSITSAPGVLLARLTGQRELPVFATSKDTFEYDVAAARLTFERDAAGKVVAVVLRQNGKVMRAPRK